MPATPPVKLASCSSVLAGLDKVVAQPVAYSIALAANSSDHVLFRCSTAL